MAGQRSFANVTALLAALRSARESQDLTLEWVADRVGVSHVSIVKWESGQQRPTAARVRQWVRALNLAPDVADQYAELRAIERVDDVLAEHGVDEDGRSAVRILVRGVMQRPRAESQRRKAAGSGS